jgi:hypothetical protein
VDDAVGRRWEREQALLGLSWDTPGQEFARGVLAALAVDPTVRIAVLAGDPSSQSVPAENPEAVVPKVITLPGGRQFPYHGMVRGTSSGYVGLTVGDGGRWQSFDAVHWHSGVDVFLGVEGGRECEVAPGSRGRVVFLQRCVGWAWGAFDLQRRMVKRYQVDGPFRAILGVADTAGAVLGYLGAGWPEPGAAGIFGASSAIEPRVLLVEDLAEWPDEKGAEELALRFGARVDLAFGGSGHRHLDCAGPEPRPGAVALGALDQTPCA